MDSCYNYKNIYCVFYMINIMNMIFKHEKDTEQKKIRYKKIEI